MLLKARSVFRSLINEIEHDWIYSYKPKWTCRIFRFLKDVAYYSTKRPYYFIKWYGKYYVGQTKDEVLNQIPTIKYLKKVLNIKENQ